MKGREKHVGSVRRAAAEPAGIQRQFEVALEAGPLRQTGNAYRIVRDAKPVKLHGLDAYYIPMSH